MSLIADGLLIVTCLTTAIYCFVLSRRLQKLSNTDEGIGQQIAQFNAALDETRSASTEIKGEAQRASDRLIKEVGAARKIAAKLQAQIEAARAIKPPSYEAAPIEEREMMPEPAPSEPEPASEKQESVVELPDEIEVPTLGEMPEENFDEDEADLAIDEFDELEGEQQLGFLPNVDIGTEDDTDDTDDVADQPIEDVVTEQTVRSENVDENGLLKVERMAL